MISEAGDDFRSDFLRDYLISVDQSTKQFQSFGEHEKFNPKRPSEFLSFDRVYSKQTLRRGPIKHVSFQP